ncbi:MAG: hypothetical protein JOZ69_12320 [Myxococcales bacterium]|nr:hypothetical protein [Myxococcales bacterium]
MIAVGLGATRADEALRATRALGAHRYVAGRAHLVHAFALACTPENAAALAEARSWARRVLEDRRVDAGSRDEALRRRCTDAELAAVLAAYWEPGPLASEARRGLEALLDRHGCPAPAGAPFDEGAEPEMHPILVDAGWELLRLSELDPERHKGAIAAFGTPIAFASACFEEETAIPEEPVLCELPAMGAAELLRGVDEAGALAAPLVAWVSGNETYVDYVIRGVRRAANLPDGS